MEKPWIEILIVVVTNCDSLYRLIPLLNISRALFKKHKILIIL